MGVSWHCHCWRPRSFTLVFVSVHTSHGSYHALSILRQCDSRCIARRRRRRGVQPFYGTGWMAPAGGKWGPNQNSHQMHGYNSGYNANYQQPNAYGANYQPPPAYGQQQPQYTGTTFNPNDGYYGQQNSGVQPPQGTYQRDDPYGPPPNPPPGK